MHRTIPTSGRGTDRNCCPKSRITVDSDYYHAYSVSPFQGLNSKLDCPLQGIPYFGSNRH
jgi:hypothetical protein